MFLSIADQVIILLISIYGGLLLGFIFDLYRFIRDIFRFGKGITALGDIIFWVLGVILILCVMYKSNSGLIRVYQLLGFAIGVIVYLKFVSGIVRYLLYALMYCIKSLAYGILKILTGPVTLISNILWKPCNKIKSKAIVLCKDLKVSLRDYVPIFKNKE